MNVRSLNAVAFGSKPTNGLLKNATNLAQHENTQGIKALSTYDALKRTKEDDTDTLAKTALANRRIFPPTEFPTIEDLPKKELLAIAINRTLLLFKSALRFAEWKDALKGETTSIQLLAHRNLAVTYERLRDYDSANERYESAVKLARTMTDKTRLPETLLMHADLHIRRDQPFNAQPMIDEALEVLEDTQTPKHFATAYRLQALLYQKQSNYGDAEDMYEQALAVKDLKDADKKKCLSAYALFLDNLSRKDEAEALRQEIRDLSTSKKGDS